MVSFAVGSFGVKGLRRLNMGLRKSFILCGALIVNLGFALRTYDSTAPLDSEKIVFSWTLTVDSAKLALQINDPSIIRANASSLWLGIGIGDPQRQVRFSFICFHHLSCGATI